ncbi:hypothetical protein DOTSEDRAFT_42794 [Dothistroma septosporum NZE10]|uniref:Transcription elongation factor Eaf N-terminal domain-containing protein n=1 Tax=Dothistroma septosporum (strain NZE10 / CBS 128990) TaxID=675120 RepID=N1PS11_DOTSN|nr:hypothetical protein DOTSEDRAFT_42794 [Dothistroma septosporum NZE10]
MAAAAIDFKAQATFPIRLGSSILEPTASSSFTSVRYNYKPQLDGADSVTATVSKGDDEGESELLLLRDGDGEYQYTGRHVQDENIYVLVVRGQGKHKEMLLEHMNGSHDFNLVSIPSERDASKLAEKYPPLPLETEVGDLFGEDEEEAPPDELNPFDYRHFLKIGLEQPQTTNANIDAARSPAVTPLPRAPPAASSPASRVVRKPAKKAEPLKKRKTNAAEKANPKRVKAGHEPPALAQATTAKSVPGADAPKVQTDRKAVVRRESFVDDDGLLVIENETPVTEKPPKHSAMALALSGQLGSGPISLRSAANSPGPSQAASPMSARPEVNEEKERYVFEFDDDAGSEPGHNEGADVDEEDDDADADVDEDIELPSPAQPHRPSVSAAVVTGGGDDDDDLEAQLAAGLMEDDDGGAQESEESEEE